MQIHTLNSPEEVCDALVVFIENKISEVLQSADRFTIALSGGSTPKLLFKKLTLSKKIQWNKIHFFWGDERDVPFSDDRNNAKMAYDELLNKVDVNPHHIHIMRTDIPIDASIKEYDNLMHQYFKDNKSFDLVLLGMGTDGHTLSLFPDGDLINDNTGWINKGVKSGEDIERITLMPALVNNAGTIVFLVCGNDKAEMLKNVIELDPYYPANLIDPVSKDLHWFIDNDAARLLSNK